MKIKICLNHCRSFSIRDMICRSPLFETVNDETVSDGILVETDSGHGFPQYPWSRLSGALVLWWKEEEIPPKNIVDISDEIIFSSNPRQVLLKLEKFFQERDRTMDANPLTGLPGNREIKEILHVILNDPDRVAVYIDLTDFKPYNEVYGFTAGDNAIICLAELLKEACKKICSEDYFLGHIGGDDFFISVKRDCLRELFDYLDREFLMIRPSFYHKEDISRGSIVGWNRSGEREDFPLTGIIGVAFSPLQQKLESPEKISEFATHLKESARSMRHRNNIFITPEDIEILPQPLDEFILNPAISLAQKRTIVEAMGESGLSQYGRILVSLLNEDLHLMLKKSIIYSLGRLRYNPAQQLLISFTSHSSAHLRTRAVEALGNIGGTRHMDIIGKMLSDPNPYVAVMAAKSIGEIGHPEGIEYLRDIPSNLSRWVRTEAAISRCLLGDRDVLNELEKLLNDPSPSFRKRAARAIELIPSDKGILLLYRAAVREKLSAVRNSIIVSFSRIAQNLTSDQIKKMFAHIWKIYRIAPRNLKVYLLPALGRCPYKKWKKILEKKLESSDKWERYRAVEAMAYSPDNVGHIRKGLFDYSGQVRARSAQALGEIKDVGSMEMLRRALKDQDMMVRKKASQSILKMARELR